MCPNLQVAGSSGSILEFWYVCEWVRPCIYYITILPKLLIKFSRVPTYNLIRNMGLCVYSSIRFQFITIYFVCLLYVTYLHVVI
jgi:hypothetical protein